MKRRTYLFLLTTSLLISLVAILVLQPYANEENNVNENDVSFELSESFDFSIQTEQEIKRALKVIDKSGAHIRINFAMNDNPPVFPTPSEPKLRVAGNEGCMCVYSTLNSYATYEKKLIKMLTSNENLGINMFGGARNYTYYSKSEDIHIRFLVEEQLSENGNFMFTFEISDHGEIISTFKQRNIPKSLVGMPDGMNVPLTFWDWVEGKTKPTYDDIWDWMFDDFLQGNSETKNENTKSPEGELLTYFPKKELQAFFDAAFESNVVSDE